jgi:hypothetical protein
VTYRVQAALALLVLVLAGAVAAVVTAPAGAATPTDKKIAALQKQMAALNKKVTTLTKQVTTEKKQEAEDISVVAALTVCGLAVTADAMSGTWSVVDQISSATQAGKTYFGTQPFLNDSGACDVFKVTRSQAVPPNLAAFQALMQLFQAPARALLAFAPFAR